MSHIIVTGAAGTGKTTVINDTIIPAYKNTHDIVRIPTGSTPNYVLTKAERVSTSRPTLVIIDEVRRQSIADAVEVLLATADSSKVMVVVAAEPGVLRTHPGKVFNLHLAGDYFTLLDAAAPVAA